MSRPLSVTLLGWLFILAGSIGIIYHATEVQWSQTFSNDALWVLFVRWLAIIGGILTLRCSNWGRWLVVVWMAYHVVLSYFHSVSELVFHLIIGVAIAFTLFHPKQNPFFNR